MKYLWATEGKTQHLLFTSWDPTGRATAWSTRTLVPFSAAVNKMTVTVSFGEAGIHLGEAFARLCSIVLAWAHVSPGVCVDGHGRWKWPRRCPVNLFTWFHSHLFGEAQSGPVHSHVLFSVEMLLSGPATRTACRQHFVLFFARGSGTTPASCSSWTFKAELPVIFCFQVSETEFFSPARAGLWFTWGPRWSQICYHLLASDPQLLELQVWATMRNFSYNFLFFFIILLLKFIFTFI